MQITEPVTMLTDYALAAASLAFALILYRMIGPGTRVSAWLWCAAFLASACAAIIGGTYHGFTLYFDASTLRVLWNVIIFLEGTTCGLMIAGVHAAYVNREDGTLKWLTWGIAVTIVGAIIQRTGFRSHEDFNHNDAYHIVQILGLYFLFKAARLLRDRDALRS